MPAISDQDAAETFLAGASAEVFLAGFSAACFLTSFLAGLLTASGAEADLAAARRISSDIDRRFADPVWQ